MVQETRYSASYTTPDWVERDKTQTLAMPIYHGVGLAIPTSGTLSVYNASNEAVVDAEAVSIVNGIATYSFLDSLTTDVELSTEWHQTWDLILEGISYSFYREQHIVRRRIYPVLTQVQLTRKHTELRDWLADDQSSLQGQIDAAWDDILLRLMERGKHPYLILSSHALRKCHEDLTLRNTFIDYASSASSDGKYMKIAEQYDKMYETDWARIVMTYDYSEDDVPHEEEQGEAPVQVLMTKVPISGVNYDPC